MLDILQKYVFEMQGNDMLPMKYQNKKKLYIIKLKYQTGNTPYQNIKKTQVLFQ